MKSHKNNDSIYVKMEKGEEIIDSLQKIIKKYDINSGWINGIGLINKVRIGSYDVTTKSYDEIDFDDTYELTSFMGNITKKDGKPFIHAHISMSDHLCKAFGGHLFYATIGAAGEFIIKVTDNIINRKFDGDTGLHLWSFEHCE